MKQAVLIGIIFTICGSTTVFAQFPQKERFRQRIEASTKASDDAEHDRRLEEEAALPPPKPAVMNVDVRIALTRSEHKTFAEAKAAEVKKIVDGEPLWLHVKFKTRLGDYVVTTRHPDDLEKLRYTLYAEIAPRADITALSQYSIQFAKEDLAATEVKINLAPGIFGRNRSIPVFLMTAGSAKAGVWNNEFRLTNTLAMPRELTENLASTPVTLDFSGGLEKYRKMNADYDSIVLRGSTDAARMPVAGTFYSEPLGELITQKLAFENIRRQKLYFSGDDWQEFATSAPQMTRTKRIFATFTYQREGSCFYGIAEVAATYDLLEAKYDEPEIKIQKGLPIPCTEL